MGLEVVLLNLGTALLVIAFQQRAEKGINPARRWTALLRSFGRNSYEIYLSHMLVVWPMMRLFYKLGAPMKTALLWFVVITTLAAVLGHLLTRFYSEPLNRLLRSRLSARTKAAIA